MPEPGTPPAKHSADWFWTILDDPPSARLWLGGLGVRDAERGLRDLRDLEARAGSSGLMTRLALQLDAVLPRCPDPGMALTNLERFVAACPRPAEAIRLVADNARAAEI